MIMRMRELFCWDGDGGGMPETRFAEQWEQMLRQLECPGADVQRAFECVPETRQGGAALSGALRLQAVVYGRVPSKSGMLVRCFNAGLLRSTLAIDETTVCHVSSL